MVRSHRYVLVFALIYGFGLSMLSAAFAQGRPDLVWMRGAHANSVYAVAYSPDGKLFASTSGDGTAKVWRLSDGMLLRTFTQSGFAVLFTPDGSALLTTDGNSTASLYRISDGQVLLSLSITASSIASLAVSPDGKLIATGTYDGRIILWRTSDGASLATLTGHSSRVDSLAFSANGQLLASGSGNSSYGEDNTVRVWNMVSLQLQMTIPGPSNYDLSQNYRVKFLSDGTLGLGVFSYQTMLYVYRPTDGSVLRSYNFGSNNLDVGRIERIIFSQDGQYLLFGYWDNAPYPIGRVRRFRTSDGVEVGGYGVGIWDGPPAIGISPDDQTGVYCFGDTGDLNHNIELMGLSDGTITDLTPPSSSGPLEAFSASADGKFVAVKPGGHGNVVVRRTSDGAVVGALAPDSDSCALTPDGSMLATHGLGNGPYALYRVSDGSLIRTFDNNEGSGIAVSPDGQLVATGYESKNLWRLSDGQLLRTLPIFGIFHQFSPDSQWLASRSDGPGYLSVCDMLPGFWFIATFGEADTASVKERLRRFA